jgi:hypothetical protein
VRIGHNGQTKCPVLFDQPLPLLQLPLLFVFGPGPGKSFCNLAQHLRSCARPARARVLWITLVFTLNNFAAFTLWSVAGDALGRVFAYPEQAVWHAWMFALTLACVALWMVWG